MKFDRAIKEEINEKTKSGIRLDLEGDDKNNAFSPGDTIKGKLIVENSSGKRINNTKIILNGIESVSASDSWKTKVQSRSMSKRESTRKEIMVFLLISAIQKWRKEAIDPYVFRILILG